MIIVSNAGPLIALARIIPGAEAEPGSKTGTLPMRRKGNRALKTVAVPPAGLTQDRLGNHLGHELSCWRLSP